MGTFMWHDQYSTFPQLVKAGYQCLSAEKVYLGNFSSLPLCASACSSKPGCRFFIYGTGRKAGTCFQELTPDASCINKQRLLA